VVAAAWAGLEAAAPECRDLEYEARLRVVRAARAEHPDRPLGFVMGSSG
jgi:hypothetical protein